MQRARQAQTSLGPGAWAPGLRSSPIAPRPWGPSATPHLAFAICYALRAPIKGQYPSLDRCSKFKVQGWPRRFAICNLQFSICNPRPRVRLLIDHGIAVKHRQHVLHPRQDLAVLTQLSTLNPQHVFNATRPGRRGGRETRCRGARPRADQRWPPTPPLGRTGPNNPESRAWAARPP